MFRSDRTTDRQLFAFSPRDLVPDESDVWLYIDLFDALDLTSFYGDYSSRGEEAVDPKLLLRSIFYGLTHGVVTGRKLADCCVFDNRLIVLSGDQRPSYRTFYRFICRHQGRLEDLFAQVVRLAQKMGLVSLGKIAIDGSRFRANTSRHKAMSLERMTKAIVEIKTELAALKGDLAKENGKENNESLLPEEIQRRESRLAKIASAKAALESEPTTARQNKPQKSFADHDARPMRKGKDGFAYGYNCQAAVDADHQIIVAAEVHDNAADCGALETMLEKVEATTGKRAMAVLADAGYKSYANLETIARHGAVAFVAVGKGEKTGEKRHLEDLRYHIKGDHFRCKSSRVVTVKQRCGDGTRILHLTKDHCRGCPLKASCRLYPRRGSTIDVPSAAQYLAAVKHQKRMRSTAGKEVYRARKFIVEPVFGNIKNKGIRIGVRGRKKVTTWWKIAATAHNIEKIIKRWP